MSSKYDKNYSDSGYLMKYEKPVGGPQFKNLVFQFKVQLEGISPTIWRRLLVPSDYNFWDFHVAIQDSMGWLDSHLHHFEIRNKGKRTVEHIGILDFERTMDLQEVLPGWQIPICIYFDVLGKEAKYLYDYSDFWMHQIKLEGYIHREKKTEYPICIGGEGSCPPEDCGGVPGYYEMLKILSDPSNEEYEEMRSWVGRDWNPQVFYKDLVIFDNPYKRWKGAFIDK